MAKNPIVTIEMENGDIMKAELYPEIAPNTVNNFISLINHNFYDGVIFHRVINGFILLVLQKVISYNGLGKGKSFNENF